MTKLIPYLLLFLLLSLGVYVYFDKASGADQKLQAIEEAYKDSIQSIRNEYDSIILTKDRQAFEAFSKAQMSANRMEGEAIFWKNEARKEKARNRVFTNSQTDSLLSLVE